MRSFGVSQATGRRSVPRRDASLIAVLSMSAGDYPATVIDISRTGARLHGELLPPLGQQLTFNAGIVRVAAEVVWSQDGSCAVEFETPIAATEVQRLRA